MIDLKGKQLIERIMSQSCDPDGQFDRHMYTQILLFYTLKATEAAVKEGRDPVKAIDDLFEWGFFN